MDVTVRHWIPGRIRLCIPALVLAVELTERIQAWVTSHEGIHSARINLACTSLIVVYDEQKRPVVKAMLGFLELLTPQDLHMRLAALDANMADAEERHEALPVPLQPARPDAGILAWPTVSMALAIFGGPVANAINVPLMLWNGLPIAKRAWRVWSRERRLNVDFLDTLAIAASLLQGLYTTGALITWLIRLGDWIRDLTAQGSKKAIGQLMEFQGKTAWLVTDGNVTQVEAGKLVAGDIVMVYPGEMIPVDGEIIDGSAMIDQKTITGESLPVNRGKGEVAFAATVLREGRITVRASRTGANTTAGQIAQLVDSAPIGDTRMQNHAERFADRLVAPTLALAIGTAAVTANFQRFLSLVIVDFGTGIRVAAPTSVLSSMTYAARSGIVIKSGGHLEKLAEVDTIVFDKTGTLTHGVPEVMDMISYHDTVTETKMLALAVAAESRLKHPVAEALRAHAEKLGLNVPVCDETEYKVGLGVEGTIGGYYLHVGSERFLRGSGIDVSAAAADRQRFDELGYSCLYCAVDGELAGLIPYADKMRPESVEVIKRLHELGVKETIMLTGDNATVARAVGKRLGITRQIADMMPAGKAEVIQQLKAEGRVVAMVGDGINDSPALTFSDVGIAMRFGAEVTHESAHVVLMEDSLWKLVRAIEISRMGVGLIKQNYWIVGVLNVTALMLALPANLVTPQFTAILSNGSAILASLNGMRPALRAA